MKISLRETLDLEKFKGFRLVAGKKGLNRLVTKIGLLDHEMLNPIKGQFVEGEFALSTLLAAKDTPELIYSSVLYLIESKASGLGVKDIYYKALPDKVIALAEAHDFPIFMFDNSVYFEDIITEFKDFIDAVQSEASMAGLIKDLLSRQLSAEEILSYYRQLLSHYQEAYRCVYVHLKDDSVSDASLIIKGHRLSKRLSILAAVPYKSGLVIIDKGDEWATLLRLMEEEQIVETGQYACGIADLVTEVEDFQNQLLKAIALTRIADVEDRAYCETNQMGIYELVTASMDIRPIQNYMQKVIEPIKAYDVTNNTTLFETVEAFVRAEGQIKMAAKIMVQHDNTIRYRLSKIRQITGVEGSDVVLYERLSLAVRFHWISQLNY